MIQWLQIIGEIVQIAIQIWNLIKSQTADVRKATYAHILEQTKLKLSTACPAKK